MNLLDGGLGVSKVVPYLSGPNYHFASGKCGACRIQHLETIGTVVSRPLRTGIPTFPRMGMGVARR